MEIKLEQGLNKSFIIKTESGKKLGYFVLDVDGYYHYKELETLTGYWDSYQLRKIADLLDEVNKPYRDELSEYFKNENGYIIDNAF